ncbi:hypothetical protein ACJA23_01940 [Mycoplasma corogypsi]|uniref:hypothetical protein n=1 Tax=Mycoplasma corogypsi TaxID=2106 RepID=UPI003873C759
MPAAKAKYLELLNLSRRVNAIVTKVNEEKVVLNSKDNGLSSEVKNELLGKIDNVQNDLTNANNLNDLDGKLNTATTAVNEVGSRLPISTTELLIKNIKELSEAIKNAFIRQLNNNSENNKKVVDEARNLANEVKATVDKIDKSIEKLNSDAFEITPEEKEKLLNDLNTAKNNITKAANSDAVRESVSSDSKLIAKVDTDLSKALDKEIIDNLGNLPIELKDKLNNKITDSTTENAVVVAKAR